MKSPPPSRRNPPAIRFRTQIEKAEAEGLAREKMILRLTLGDANLLKRDPTLDVADIGFVGGAMWFLGVKVEEGGVSESELVSSS